MGGRKVMFLAAIFSSRKDTIPKSSRISDASSCLHVPSVLGSHASSRSTSDSASVRVRDRFLGICKLVRLLGVFASRKRVEARGFGWHGGRHDHTPRLLRSRRGPASADTSDVGGHVLGLHGAVRGWPRDRAHDRQRVLMGVEEANLVLVPDPSHVTAFFPDVTAPDAHFRQFGFLRRGNVARSLRRTAVARIWQDHWFWL